MSARIRLGLGTGIVLVLAGLLAWQATVRERVTDHVQPAATVQVAASTPISAPPPTVPAEVAAVELALASWSKFAATGDLEVLAGTFDPEGPQYRQMATEAPLLKAFPRLGRPRFEIESDGVRDGPRGPVVRASIDFVIETATHSWCWDVHLRPVPEGFRVWTVVEVQSPRTSTTSARSPGSVAPNICP